MASESKVMIAWKAVTFTVPPTSSEVAAVPAQQGEGADGDRLQDRADDQGRVVADAQRRRGRPAAMPKEAAGRADGSASQRDGVLI